MQLAESLLPTPPPKPVQASGSLFTAYAFSVNFILGAGVLGLPYAFHRAGVLLSCLFLIFVSFVAILSITWIVEALARAETFLSMKRQATHVRQHADQPGTLSDDDDDAILRSMAASDASDDDDEDVGERVIVNQETEEGEDWVAVQRTSPPFLIRKRKIEMGELCDIFLGSYVRRFFELSITCYVYGSLWLYASIFASSLVTAIPVVHLTSTFECDVQNHKTPGYCQQVYYLYVGVYSCISLMLVMRDLSNQKKLQIGLSMMAIFGIFLMILTTLINMGTQPLDDVDRDSDGKIHPEPANTTHHTPYIEDSTLLDFSGFGKLFTAALFSQVCHYGIPSLVQLIPAEKKTQANKVFFAATTTTCICYCLLGVTTALYYGEYIETLITLNWQNYHAAVSRSDLTWWVYIIRYFIVLFPAVLVTAAFPLNAIALSNNLMDSFPSSLSSKFSSSQQRIICRLVSSIPPLIAALFLPNASTILNITGLFAFVLAFWIPCMLVIASRRQSIARWGQSAATTPYSWHFSHLFYVYGVFAFSIGAFLFTIVELIHPF